VVEEESMHVKLDELWGMKVFDANGRAIGTVRAALVDMETWLVDTLRIGVARRAAADLDLRWSPWSFWRPPTIDVGTGQINAAGDAIILRVSLGELREAPPPDTAALTAVH
jgi:sporulation protein YlmC with PRC-barrel domain